MIKITRTLAATALALLLLGSASAAHGAATGDRPDIPSVPEAWSPEGRADYVPSLPEAWSPEGSKEAITS
jgi:hypothetical protein